MLSKAIGLRGIARGITEKHGPWNSLNLALALNGALSTFINRNLSLYSSNVIQITAHAIDMRHINVLRPHAHANALMPVEGVRGKISF